jgi:hypothetical protein
VLAHGRTGDVFVIKDGDMVEKRAVTLGPVSQQTAIILSGVTASERLASGNLAGLKDGDRVTIAQ